MDGFLVVPEHLNTQRHNLSMYILRGNPPMDTDGPHTRSNCSPTYCPMCDFSNLVDGGGDSSNTSKHHLNANEG